MLRALGLSRGAASEPPSRSSSSVSVNLLDEAIALEHALRAMDLLMDDRIAEAEKIISVGDSTFFKLARGVIAFIEATLGFEPDVIKKASEALYEAEEAATADRQRAVKAGYKTSAQFPPGLEYAVVYAESQLLGAITLFLSESVIDTAKALLKLRRAYQTLDDVYRQMKTANYKSAFIDATTLASSSTPNLHATNNGNSTAANSAAPSLSQKPSLASIKTSSSVSSSSTTSKSTTSTRNKHKKGNDDDDDGILTIERFRNPEVSEKARMFERIRLERSSAHALKTSSHDEVEDFITRKLQEIQLKNQKPSSTTVAGQEAVDEYIISAVNACYGILQLVISILPPGLGKVLSIVGFRGSKDESLRLLWHAVESLNIHGALGLLALLQYYDGPTQVSDINLPEKEGQPSFEELDAEPLPEDDDMLFTTAPDPDDQAATKRRLRVGLRRARKHFAKGALWQLQEGRMEASRGRLREAIAIMDDTSRGPINLRQVEGLMLFDKSMFIVTIHGFEVAADNFIRLIDLNTWSHMFYTYLSAVCHVEIYRKYKHTDPERAAASKKLAAEAMDRAPSFLGKRKFMAKTMPFDVFTLRKLNQWKATAKANKIHIVDAIGTSPIHEVIYFWNGFGRMLPQDLEESISLLGYTADPKAPHSFNDGSDKDIIEENEDEALIRYLLQSISLRSLGKVEEGFELLKTKVISKIYVETPNRGHYPSGLPKVHFTKTNHDPWVAPCAVYELAVFVWQQEGVKSIQKVRDYLDIAHSWGDDYELSTRVGLKIKTAVTRLENIE